MTFIYVDPSTHLLWVFFGLYVAHRVTKMLFPVRKEQE